MSSFNRRTVILTLAALPACGFTPVYAPGSDPAALRGAVSIGAPDSPNAFRLTRALELRLGQATEPEFTLAVDVTLEEEGSVITRTSEIERFTIRGEASYALGAIGGSVITKGATRAFTSYSASGTPVATRAAREDAQERLMVILADRIVSRLAADLS